MAAQHLLYFTAEDHYLYRAARGELELEAQFSGDDARRRRLPRVPARRARGALFSVLADLAGEDFHEEQIPCLRGGDRDAVVQRRLAQRYRDTRLAAALSLGAVTPAERRNERLLLASFTNTQQFAPWLDALEEAGARLAGVYSVPLLAPALAARLGVRGGRALRRHREPRRAAPVLRRGRQAALRAPGAHRATWCRRRSPLFVRSETLRLAQYLVTLRALPRDGAPLQVLVVAPPGQRARVRAGAGVRRARSSSAPSTAPRRSAPSGCGAGPRGHARPRRCTCTSRRRKPPREQFASSADRRRYFVWQLQRGIVAAGALGFAACALFGGARWLDVLDAREQRRRCRRARRAPPPSSTSASPRPSR